MQDNIEIKSEDKGLNWEPPENSDELTWMGSDWVLLPDDFEND